MRQSLVSKASTGVVKQFEVCVAPMMKVTDFRMRYVLRHISPSCTLYTEMVGAWALMSSKNPSERLLVNHDIEDPLALQIGGSDPTVLIKAIEKVNQSSMRHKELNFNCGCPSPTVTKGGFGASLMLRPDVHEIVSLAANTSREPVTVKCRIGVDDQDNYEFLRHFVESVHKEAGVNKFIVHARKAPLKGLSPSENRTIPPLNYERVYQIKNDFPELTVILNGGIKSLQQVHDIKTGSTGIDGVMLGRAVQNDPWIMWKLHKYETGDYQDLQELERRCPSIETRIHVIKKYLEMSQFYEIVNEKPSYHVFMKPLRKMWSGTNISKFWVKALHADEKTFKQVWDDIEKGNINIYPAAAASARPESEERMNDSPRFT